MSVQQGSVVNEQAEFLEELCAAGLLIPSGVAGVYGHGWAFERIREALSERVREMTAGEGAIRWSFPPVAPRYELETTGYLGNFPHLAASLFGFDGSEQDGIALGELAAAHQDWSAFQRQTELIMLPAACYPAYPAIAALGPLRGDGVMLDLGATWVFRKEPSMDPARQQSFRVHELIRMGPPDVVAKWRSRWARQGVELFTELGLECRLENASDPFFGRQGRMMAQSQSDDELKLELLVGIAGREPTACASFNCHLDHFAKPYGLRLENDAAAHTACAGFGQDRIVLALLRTHGLDPDNWPPGVQARLWPEHQSQ